MLVANAALNSYRLPYGPRPITSPRTASDATSDANAKTVIQVAARDSGVGEAESETGASARAARKVTKGPVTPPEANAGRGPVGARTRARRPFASRTAWPTWAAKPIAVAMTPTGNRSEESCSMGSCPGTLRAPRMVPGVWSGPAAPGGGQAAARPPDGGPAGRSERGGGFRLNERPQLPQVDSVAGRTSVHFRDAPTSSPPSGGRVVP